MNTVFRIVKGFIPHFNERQVTENDCFFLVDLKHIDFTEMKLKRRGYHVFDDGIDYVFVKKTLRGLKWLETAIHELFHVITGAPMDEIHDKQQREVVALCLIALIPLPMMMDYRFLEENPTPYARRLFREREKVYFLYGV